VSIHFATGDATKPAASHNLCVIVHIVNDIGAWGAGFVRTLSRTLPMSEKLYRDWHMMRPRDFESEERTGPLALGHVQLVTCTSPFVANVCGQHGIKSARVQSAPGHARVEVPPIRYDALRTGLERLEKILSRRDESRRLDSKSYLGDYQIHMPRIGTGLAGGDWDLIEPIVADVFKDRRTVVYRLPVASSRKR
jgi:hypothetical protein